MRTSNKKLTPELINLIDGLEHSEKPESLSLEECEELHEICVKPIESEVSYYG